MRARFVLAVIGLVAPVLASAACGSDSSPATDATPVASTTGPAPAPPAPPPPPAPDGGACESPKKNCSGTCVDTKTDPKNCGDCAVVCTTAQACVGGSCQSATFTDITDASKWVSYDLATGVTANAKNFSGGAFDGRYVYFAPYQGGTGGLVTRYDTQSNAFTTGGSWSTYDAVANVDSNASGFNGAVFDGRYVYFIPWYNKTLVRYDTTKSFTDPGSYDKVVLSIIDAGAAGYVGGTFDGQYLYLAPYYASGSFKSLALRYDTKATLASVGSWKTYDLTNKDVDAEGFMGAVFDGKYVYLAPFRKSGNGPNPHVVRYDTTTAAFDQDTSWETFDTQANVDPNAAGYEGAAFDGKSVYLVPANAATVVRYDTSKSFTAGASWTPYTTSTITSALEKFEYGGFDGKSIYLGANAHTRIARVDTSGTFTDPLSWSSFDVATLTPAAGATGGMVFDGRYMYFLPSSGSVAVRYDAKSPSAVPPLPAHHGSFY